MRRTVRYDPKPVAADPLWDVMGPPGESIVGPKGERGEPGLSIEGKPGADAQGWNFRGEWKRSAEYGVNDVVTSDGSSYLSLVENKGKEPPSKHWSCVAAAGEPGEATVYQGQRGRPGRDGVDGAPGGGGSTPLAFIADTDILKGQALRVSSAGHCTLADASDFSMSEVVALAVTDTANGMAGLMQAGDSLTLEDWTSVVGSTSLSAGLAYFLSETPGQLSTTPTTGEGKCVCFVGRSLSETELLIEVGSPIVLSE